MEIMYDITQRSVMERWFTVQHIPLWRPIGSSDSIVKAGGDGGLGTRSESSGGWWECCRQLYTWRVGGGGLNTKEGSQIIGILTIVKVEIGMEKETCWMWHQLK